MAEALIKQLAGEDLITVRFLYAEFFEFKPTFTIFLAANHKPAIRRQDIVVWRRIRRGGARHPDWAIAGFREQEGGLRPPKGVARRQRHRMFCREVTRRAVLKSA
jgi:hypothetical protein